MADHNQGNLSGLVELMRSILIVIISIELIGAILLGTRFYFTFRLGKKLIFTVSLQLLVRLRTADLI